LQQESETLRATIATLQQEVHVIKESRSEQEQLNNEIVQSIKEGFNSLKNLKSLADKDFNLEFNNKSEIKKAIGVIHEAFNNKEQDLEKSNQDLAALNEKLSQQEIAFKQQQTGLQGDLNQKLSELREENEKLESQSIKEKIELNKITESIKEEAIKRLKDIKQELKEVLKYVSDEDVPNVPLVLESGDFIPAKQITERYLEPVKHYITSTKKNIEDYEKELQANKAEIQGLAEKLEEAERARVENENNHKELDEENKNLKMETDQLREMYIKKTSEIEEAKANTPIDLRADEHRDPSFSIQDEIDDLKVKSFLEESIKIEAKNYSKKGEKSVVQEEQETIKSLYEQIRILQDENERLETENKQVRTNYEMLGFVNEDLKAELTDKEEEMKLADSQLVILKEEFTKMQKEVDKAKKEVDKVTKEGKSAVAHEKQHIRIMFLKFIQSVLQGTKDAPDLLQFLLSLLDLGETDKQTILNDFKSKMGKKGGFKLF